MLHFLLGPPEVGGVSRVAATRCRFADGTHRSISGLHRLPRVATISSNPRNASVQRGRRWARRGRSPRRTQRRTQPWPGCRPHRLGCLDSSSVGGAIADRSHGPTMLRQTVTLVDSGDRGGTASVAVRSSTLRATSVRARARCSGRGSSGGDLAWPAGDRFRSVRMSSFWLPSCNRRSRGPWPRRSSLPTNRRAEWLRLRY